MSTDLRNRHWYAIFVASGQEDYLKININHGLSKDYDFRMVVPRRIIRERKSGVWSDVIRTLFPGYIFMETDMTIPLYTKLRKITGVIKVLENEGEPIPMETDEIVEVQRLISDDEIIGFSSVLIEDDAVKIIRGPLVGQEDLIESINRRKGRVKVNLKLFGETRIIELGIKIIETVDESVGEGAL